MRTRAQRVSALVVIGAFLSLILGVATSDKRFQKVVVAQDTPPAASPTPGFDQKAAIAKLREKIKGSEDKPAEEVFENIKIMKGFPAGRVLAIMQFGFSRSLGVDCTHCHTPDAWASESKPTKQIARDMWHMQMKINSELLKGIDGLKDRRAVVNCTTCHRGQTKPATNLGRSGSR